MSGKNRIQETAGVCSLVDLAYCLKLYCQAGLLFNQFVIHCSLKICKCVSNDFKQKTAPSINLKQTKLPACK